MLLNVLTSWRILASTFFSASVFRLRAELRHQDDLANIFSRFDVSVGLGDLIERKSAIDVWLNPALVDSAYDLLRPVSHFLAFAPHVTEVQAEHALVAIHQGQRMKLRRLHQSLHRAELPADAACRCRRHAEDSH